MNNPFFGLCLDIGHLNLFADDSAPVWVKAMGARLQHVHLHDNDGKADHHWPIGKGVIDFDTFFYALEQYTPEAVISLEVDGTMRVRMRDLRKLAGKFTAKINNKEKDP